MRLAVLADVHGNLPALQAVLADMRRQRVDGIIVAGDLVGGPQPVEVLGLLRSLNNCWMIRGNSDNYFLDHDAGNGPDGWRTSKQWAPMRSSYRYLDREALDFVASLPEQRVIALDGVAPIRVVHGSPWGAAEGLFPDRDPVMLRVFRDACLLAPDCEPVGLDSVLARIDERVLVCGHTHIPWKQEQDGGLVFNPGAVCGPLNGDARAQYALLAWQDGRWRVEHRAVVYDLERIRAAFDESRWLAEGGALSRAFLLSIETGRNVGVYFLNYAYGLAAEAGFEGCDVVPDAVWERAEDTFDWDGAVGNRELV